MVLRAAASSTMGCELGSAAECRSDLHVWNGGERTRGRTKDSVKDDIHARRSAGCDCVRAGCPHSVSCRGLCICD
eukprot:3784115-Prymnesium_polylepis.1